MVACLIPHKAYYRGPRTLGTLFTLQRHDCFTPEACSTRSPKFSIPTIQILASERDRSVEHVSDIDIYIVPHQPSGFAYTFSMGRTQHSG